MPELTDLNDLAQSEGLDVVAQQLMGAIPPDSSAPPEIPAGASGEGDADSGDAETAIDDNKNLENLLKRYAWAMPEGRIWDSHACDILKVGPFKTFITPKLYKQWSEHEDRRTVNTKDVRALVATAQADGGEGLAEALERYV